MSDEKLPVTTFPTKASAEYAPCSLNRRMAVTPFSSTSIEVKTNKGFAHVMQKSALIPLKIVFDFESTGDMPTLLAGDTVYVKGDAQAHQWAKEVFAVDGKEFIFLPVEFAMLVRRAVL